MKKIEFSTRRLVAGDGQKYKDIRLKALKNSPEAFGSTYEKEAIRSVDEFESRVETGCVFAAFVNDNPIGMAGFYQQTGSKMEHKGVLWGMYVDVEYRQSGVGFELVMSVLDQAKGLVDLVTLAVVSNNASAVGLYEKAGFVSYGVEPRALKVGDDYLSETLMLRDLD